MYIIDVKKFIIVIFGLVVSIGVFAQLPTTSQNYIVEKTFRREYKSTANITGKPVDSINVNIQYFDGLGRPLQTVQWQGSPTKKDIVQHVEYDEFGRESKKYLPYAEQSTNNGSYKTAAKTNQGNFYKVGGGWDANVMKTNSPYAVTVFENSPLNRFLEQGAPGDAWQPATSRTTTGRTVVTDYGTNVASGTEAVKLWKINANNIGATGAINYTASKLYKTILKDENWVSGKAGTVEEYKDFEDRVILKRVWENETKKLETYYVYDDFGDLRFVVPPGYTATSITENDPVFNELIYAYKYDGRRRLIEKKIPSKGWEYIVYNDNDQAVLTQDAVQRTSKKWSYTKYDAFGRVTETGIYTNTLINNRQNAVDSIENHKINNVKYYWEERNGVNYSNRSFPTSSGKKVYVINYYDDYSFKSATLLPASSGLDSTYLVKTLLTGSKVFKDDGTTPLLTVNYYDKRGRLIQSASQNHLNTITPGTDYVTNTYSFVGEVLTSKREHKASASGAVTTLLTTNNYDHVGRLKDSKHKINTQTEVVIARNEYNEIGQLKSKKQHSENSGTNFINTMTYSYNERGWTTKATSPNFTYQLNYNTGTSPQYNGNIAQQLWGHGSINTPNVYSYSYDKLNRLLNGTSTGTVMSEVLTYDDMGNIKTLKRDNGTDITYNYTVNSVASNRLQGLTGGLTGTYTYDANGNAKTDRTGMNFTYNHLNLPDSVWSSTVKVGYLYDANGTKLRKYKNNAVDRDYVAGIEYAAGNIEMIHTPEGYLQRGSNNLYTYHYNLTDHLGNVRATLKPTSVTTGEIIQKHDYYPFGKSKALLASGINKYLYNGKEVQSELGDQYDYGARFYDAEIGRWNVVDPHANLYDAHSPYAYGFNNPIKVIDPNGKDGIVTGSGTKDDPFRVKANYYYYDLDEDQISGLNAAVAQYNNGGKAHSFKDKDGNTIYTVFELNASQVSAENAGKAHDIAYNDRVEIGGKEYQYGNVISNGQSRGGDLGNATGTTININRDKIESTLSSNPGGDRVKLITGTFVHEIGHNLGASHGDPGSIMNQMNMSEIGRGGNSIGGGGTGTFNYSYPSVNSSGIRAIMGRTNNPNSLESMYLTPREVRRVIQHKDPGAPGALYKVR